MVYIWCIYMYNVCIQVYIGVCTAIKKGGCIKGV